VHYGTQFSNFDYIFTEFIDHFEFIKKQGNIEKIFAKLMINSLYGRLGMSDIEEHTFFLRKKDISKIANLNIISLKEVNDFFLICAEIDENLKKKFTIKNTKVHSNILLAAAITSKARIKLYTAQQSVIQNGGRLLYSDTDSIFAAFTKNVL
jgi:DNA polymerase elongation subunit (family B)